MYQKICRPINGLVLFVLLISTIPLFPPSAANASETSEPIGYMADKWAVAPEWTTAPVIDGALDEPLWANAAVLDDFRTAYALEPLDHAVNYKIAYSSEYLYIGGRMAQAEADSLARIEVILTPTNMPGAHHVVPFRIDPADTSIGNTYWYRTYDDNFINDNRQTVTSAVYQTQVADGYLYLEAAIPIASIVGEGVDAGDEWGINIVQIEKLNEAALNSWVPIRTSERWDRGNGSEVRYHAGVIDESRLGSLFFGQLPLQHLPTGSGATTLAPWDTLNANLYYKSYSEMELTFDKESWDADTAEYRLQWKSPGGDWQELAPSSTDEDVSTFTITFEHPPTKESGMYQLRLTAVPVSASTGLLAHLLFDRESFIKAGLSTLEPAESSEEPVTVVWSEPSTLVEETMELIPEQPGFRYVGLPEMPDLYPDMLYELSEDGHSLIATRTSTVYPNVQFLEDQAIEVGNALGDPVSIPYYEDNEGKQYPITAHLWYLQKLRAIGQTAEIAKTDPLGAARLLYQFSQVYKGYNPTIDQAWYYNSIERQNGPPYSYWGGMWYRWYGSDLQTLTPLIRAYSDVKKTNAFDLLSVELGVDVEQKLLDEMFRPSVDYVLSYPTRLGNLSYTNWKGMIEYGKAMQEPDYIHRVVELMNIFVSNLFLSDGFWQEISLSYHNALVDGIVDAANLLRGWTDPVGYISPRTGTRLVDLDMERDFPIIGKAAQMQNILAYPDGKYYPVNDTLADRVAPDWTDVGSLLLPVAGVGRLAGGEGSEQTQVYMNFTPNYKSHYHYDPLSLSLYAEGQELLPDLGYTFNTIYRWFSRSTMGHNTVVVNSHDAAAATEEAIDGGTMESFVAEDGSFKAMRASFEGAYTETDEYSREPWFIPFADGDGQQGYVLDLFRVSGGNRHEYTLQGDANRDAFFSTDLTLTDYGPYLLPPGTDVVAPTSNSDSGSAEGHYPGYIYVNDVQQAELDGDRFELTLNTSEQGNERSKMRITGLLEEGSNELYLGRSPSLRTGRLYGRDYDNNDEAAKYTMPKMVLRRDGTDLQSKFVTVMEPYAGEAQPRIEVAERLQPDGAPDGAIAVKVVYGDQTDILISNPDHPEQPVVVEGITMYGQMGLIRLVNGAVSEMSLAAGTSLSNGVESITDAGPVQGEVSGTLREADGDDYNAIVTETPVGSEAIGQYVVVRHPDQSTRGFKIGNVLEENGETILVLADEDPGFMIRGDGTSAQTTHPSKQWTGTNTFTIANVVRSDDYDPSPVSGTGTLTGIVYDPDGNPLQGADLNLAGYTSITAHSASDGSFTLANVPAGTHWVTAAKAGYVRTVSTASVTITGGQTLPVTVAFKRYLPPVLTDTPPIGVVVGEDVHATSNADGYIYIVPIGTLNTMAAIKAAAITVGEVVHGTRSAVTAGTPGTIDTTGMLPGKYVLYAVDESDQVSRSKIVYLAHGYKPIIDDTDVALHVSDGWSDRSSTHYYGGTTKLSQRKGATIEIPFYGTRAKLISLLGSSRGQADIYLDGVYSVTIDAYSSSTQYNQVIYDTGTLTEGVHVVGVVVKGEKQGSATNAYISIDALQTLNEGPTLSAVTAGPILAGAVVTATSSKTGHLYLVPSDTAYTRTAIEAAGIEADGRTVAVTANVYGTLDTTGLPTNLYSLYGIDDGGKLSAAGTNRAVIDPFTLPVVIDDTQGIVQWSGAWSASTNASHYGGGAWLSNQVGAYADIPFFGTRAKVLSGVGTSRGKADVYVDGQYVTRIDTYSPSTKYQHEIYDTGTLAEGLHLIRVVVTGERNVSASNAYISIDALQTLNVGPILSAVTEGPVAQGSIISATSSKTGTLYLVPADTPYTRSAIMAAGSETDGRSFAVTANVYGTLDTTGLPTNLYSLYGIDQGGLLSAVGTRIAVIDPLAQPEVIDDTQAIVQIGGTWSPSTNVSHYGGGAKLSNQVGAYVDIPFYGTRAKVLSGVGTSRGKADVYVDGVLVTRIDTYSSSTKYQHEIYDTGSLSEGMHHVRLVVTGERNASATNAYISFDALRVVAE
ncbi:carboxypeptidase regulatory-like domain-containing protein [Paenibacillus koleovorans]|uniref:carboxypeptidase regulatory-like domain-containing protein n=1 Tax=Paenibacillus koleovorans TaxID=121608 RepID=UPI000FD88DAD|nr:carboxypeptidase regulatory-like domain-containing protein [Paenibacillus koleovorans]